MVLVIAKKERSRAPWLISAYWLNTNFTLIIVFIVRHVHPPEQIKKAAVYFINFQNVMETIFAIGLISYCTEHKLLKKTAALAAIVLLTLLLAFIVLGGLGNAQILPMIMLAISLCILFELLWLYTNYKKVKNNFSDKFLLLQNMSFIFNCGTFIIPCVFFYILKYTRHHPIEDLLILTLLGTLCSLLICIAGMARYLPIKSSEADREQSNSCCCTGQTVSIPRRISTLK